MYRTPEEPPFIGAALESGGGTTAASVEPFSGEITVYLRAVTPDAARECQHACIKRFKALSDAGVVEETSVTRWPTRIRKPAEPSERAALECYEELLDAVGREPLAPFFTERSSQEGGQEVTLPVICVVARRDDDVVGVYPRRKNGEYHSVEDCLRALASGDCIENVSGP